MKVEITVTPEEGTRWKADHFKASMHQRVDIEGHAGTLEKVKVNKGGRSALLTLDVDDGEYEAREESRVSLAEEGAIDKSRAHAPVFDQGVVDKLWSVRCICGEKWPEDRFEEVRDARERFDEHAVAAHRRVAEADES